MKTFKYILRDEQGKRKKGTVRADSEQDASVELITESNMLISLVEVNDKQVSFWEKPHLSFEDKLMFTKHISTMIQVGITIAEAIQVLKEQSRTKNNKKMYQAIFDMIRGGNTLSASLRKYPNVFTPVFVNMIETGEESGTLETVLQYLDVQLDKEYELRKRVVSAFVYPIVIVGITLLLTLGIVLFVMPKITDIFDSFDVVLPLPTRILIGFSNILTEHPLLSILGAMVLTFLTIGMFKWKTLRPFWHKVILYIPIFGRLMHYVNLAQFARTLNSLLEAGVPITRALQITQNASTNHLYQEAIREAAEKVEKGGKLGEAFLGHENLFPPLVTQMISIGERSGSLGTASQHLAILYERNVDGMTRNLTVLLEPLLLVFMGGLVGGVAISIILPIYQLPNLIS